jgi:very-short-patch-repair endonuclease
LQATNFGANIRWTATSSISIVPPQSLELDGGGHSYRVGQVRDRRRSEFLARNVIIVLRFWNHRIRQELDSVLQAISFALQERCSSNPSP